MKTKQSFLWFLVILLILASCDSNGKQPLATPSNTVEPSATVTPTIARPTETLRPIPTLTVTLIPLYPTKKVLLDYYQMGNHSIFDVLYTDHSWSELVLYTDGQLIIPDETPQQTVLSPKEIEEFLSKLESLGFYWLESNQTHDPTDKLYNYGNNYERWYDALYYCISVNNDKSRNLCAYEPGLPYLIPKMKSVLQYLDEYQPTQMSPYMPDRILLWVERGRDLNITSLPEESIPWKDNFPHLTGLDNRILYVEGNTAGEIFALFNHEVSIKVFNQDGIDYTVLINVVLPHEEITNLYER